ncbi:MAG: hypothetical protein ACREON_00445 [Gemmatimonadaceae bacterium]
MIDASSASSATQIAREAYEAWNAGIEREIFSGQWAGQPVYLDLEEEVLARIARTVDGGSNDPAESLSAAVRPTLHPLADGVGLFAEHLRRELEWRSDGGTATPPFLAVLGFLSLVAEGMRTDEKFRVSNYYDRLAIALGVETEKSAKPKIVRCFMDESHVLWAALNSWLEDHEGRLGLPTAHAFDYRVHVGVPMSQALVSAGDRLVLRELFVAYRLRPGQSLSRSDMLRLIEDWLPASSVSSGLKRLSRQREALERVADVASVELSAWDGTTREEREVGGALEASILVSAVLREHPRPLVQLELLVHSLVPLPDGEYRLDSDTGSHARAALADTDGRLTLTDARTQGWRGFVESGQVSMPDVMFASLRLANRDATLTRDPRRLLVLEYDEEYRRYVEVNRVTLGRDNLVMCHESLLPAFEGALDTIARPGFRKRRADELKGLPDGWVAFEPIEILAISETEDVDLAALVPLSWSQVSLGGGYPLPSRSTWLRGSPPEVRASSLAEREATVMLTCERSLDGEPPPTRELVTFHGSTVLDLPSDGLPDGDYRIAIKEPGDKGSTLGSSVFRIRSADHPRAAAPGGGFQLAYNLDADPQAAISAQPCEASGDAIRGAAVPGTNGGSPDALQLLELIPRSLSVVGSKDEEIDADVGESHPRGGDAPLCLMGTSAHHWILEDGGRYPGLKAGWSGTCKHCGIEKWFPRRPGSRRGRDRRRGRQAPATPTPLELQVEAPPIEPDAHAGLDTLLEAASFAQQGSWGSFDALASRVDDAPWFPLEVARLLGSLGHIDLQLNSRNIRPERWSIAPTTLSISADGGDAALGGYRSASLVERLADDVAAVGGTLEPETVPGSPTLLVVKGLAEDALREAARSTSDAMGTEVLVEVGPAERLVSRLPDIDDVLPKLPALQRALDAPVEKFDFERNQWDRVHEVDTPGAYRFLTQPRLIAARLTNDSSLRVADNRLVKWLAARALGLQMLAYEPNAQTLTCPLGAQLPGLYERAAVLSSSRPPTPRANGTVTYDAVAPEVATGLWERLVQPSGDAR